MTLKNKITKLLINNKRLIKITLYSILCLTLANGYVNIIIQANNKAVVTQYEVISEQLVDINYRLATLK